MPRFSRIRLLTVFFSLCALLFAQAALAGYACPGNAKAIEIAQMTEAGLPCAESMPAGLDAEQAALCHAHCQSDHSSADAWQPPPPAALMDLGVVLTLPAAAPARALRLEPVSRRDGAGPPLCIRHCCLRI